jgi:hypothetical protein
LMEEPFHPELTPGPATEVAPVTAPPVTWNGLDNEGGLKYFILKQPYYDTPLFQEILPLPLKWNQLAGWPANPAGQTALVNNNVRVEVMKKFGAYLAYRLAQHILRIRFLDQRGAL